MHGMEIHTAVRYNVPLVIVVINNSALGNVYLRARKAGGA
jgi:acetolactate synthase-1/2/3 large subunit